MNVTFDPDAVNPKLVLSDDGKQVHHGDVRKNLPDNLKRFFPGLYVLWKQNVYSGRLYFKVQAKGKTGWVLRVSRE